MPNNRQLAVLFWFIVFAVWAITRPDVRTAIRQVVKAAASPKIFVIFACLLVWMGTVVWVGAQVGLWEPTLITDTMFWFLGSGLVLFFAFGNVSRRPGFLREKTVVVLAPAATLEGLVDALVFPLPVEFIAQPFLAFIGVLLVVTKSDEKYRPARKLLDGITVLAGVLVLLHIVGTLGTRWDQLDGRSVALQVALPVWTTLCMLPFIFAFAVMAQYESAFIRLDWASKRGRASRLRSKLAL